MRLAWEGELAREQLTMREELVEVLMLLTREGLTLMHMTLLDPAKHLLAKLEQPIEKVPQAALLLHQGQQQQQFLTCWFQEAVRL